MPVDRVVESFLQETQLPDMQNGTKQNGTSGDVLSTFLGGDKWMKTLEKAYVNANGVSVTMLPGPLWSCPDLVVSKTAAATRGSWNESSSGTQEQEASEASWDHYLRPYIEAQLGQNGIESLKNAFRDSQDSVGKNSCNGGDSDDSDDHMNWSLDKVMERLEKAVNRDISMSIQKPDNPSENDMVNLIHRDDVKLLNVLFSKGMAIKSCPSLDHIFYDEGATSFTTEDSSKLKNGDDPNGNNRRRLFLAPVHDLLAQRARSIAEQVNKLQNQHAQTVPLTMAPASWFQVLNCPKPVHNLITM